MNVHERRVRKTKQTYTPRLDKYAPEAWNRIVVFRFRIIDYYSIIGILIFPVLVFKKRFERFVYDSSYLLNADDFLLLITMADQQLI